MSRRIHGARCDCLGCYGFRLATLAFLLGVAAIALLGIFIRAGDPKPLLVDDAPVSSSSTSTGARQ